MLAVRLRARRAGLCRTNSRGESVGIVVSLEKATSGKKPTLDSIHTLVADDLTRVNQLVLDKMHSPVVLIPQLAGHIIAAGGKRLRPVLTLAAARLFGYHGDRPIGLAASVEFIHTETLRSEEQTSELQSTMRISYADFCLKKKQYNK